MQKSIDTFLNIQYNNDSLKEFGVKTEVIMQRELIGEKVRQKHLTGFFSLSDLEKIGNRYRLDKGLQVKKATDYFRTPANKEFIEALKKEYPKIESGGRGRGKEKWIHPFLFIDIALWYNPELKVQVYEWVYDNLTLFRDNSGESFKKMAKALGENCNIRGQYGTVLPRVATLIYKAVGVDGKDKWETATTEQLKLRNKIQDTITTLTYVIKNADEAVSKGIYITINEKHKNNMT